MDPQNPQEFYEVTPEGTRAPETAPQKPQRSVLRIVIWVLVVVLVVAGAYFVVRALRGGPTAGEDSILGVAKASIEAELKRCENEDDAEACQNALWADVAVEMGQVSLCEMVTEARSADCVRAVAYSELDADLCESLDDDDLAACVDAVSFDLAEEQMDVRVCDDITDETTRALCVGNIENLAAASGDCVAYGVDEALCDIEGQIDEIVALGNVDLCGDLPSEEDVETCAERVAGTDADRDGLSAAQEYDEGTSDADEDSDDDGLSDYDEVYEYGTDPANADTDGDGYPDGTEVSAGFDPLS